jgi:hypothetical protein
MRTILKDYIGYFETTEPVATISYLEPEITKIDPKNPGKNLWEEENPKLFSSYTEMGLKINSLFIQTETHRVSSSVNIEMSRDLQSLYGVDMTSMLTSTLENEMEMMTEKRILEKIENESVRNWKFAWTKFQTLANKWFGYEPKMVWNSHRDFASQIAFMANKMLSENRMGGQIFIITNGRIAAEIQDIPDFNPDRDGKTTSFSPGIFSAGDLFGIKILVNPNWTFKEDKILMGIKPSSSQNARIFMIENPEVSFETIVSPDTLETKNVLVRMFGIKEIPSKNYMLLKIAEEGKRHNLFTHLISKIWKK